MNNGWLRYFILPVSLLLFLVTGCSKEEEEERISGIDTIESTIYPGEMGYYAIGFSFDQGKSISTDSKPKPDITVHPLTGTGGEVTGAYLDTPIPVSPFAFASGFDTPNEAKAFYDALAFVTNPAWVPGADPIKENQIWIFKTTQGKYAKFRIVEITAENRTEGAWVSVRFEWRVQPDGTATF